MIFVKNVIKKIIRLLYKIRPIGYINYCGFKLFYNRGNGLIKRYKREDLWPNFFNLLRKFVTGKNNLVFVDIGAHVGLISVFVRSINHNATIYAFEPSPLQRSCLEKSVNVNNLDIKVIPLAVSDSKGEVDMYVSLIGDERYDSIFPREKTKKIKVESTTFDQWVKNNNLDRLDILKIDVEGAEEKVIQGSMDSIKLFKPIIFLETAKDSNTYNTLLSLGYKIEPINYDSKNGDFVAVYNN